MHRKTISWAALAALCCGAVLPAATAGGPARAPGAGAAPVSVTALLSRARARVNSTARVPLAAPDAEPVRGLVSPDAPAGSEPSHLLRAVAAFPATPRAMGHAVQTIYLRGTVAPEIKLAMALQQAQQDNAPYVGAHAHRLLRATGYGQRLARALGGSSAPNLSFAEAAALRYTAALGPGPRYLDEEAFRAVRAWYNDRQVVELTIAVCFNSYLNRLSEALHLPVEPWALESPATVGEARPYDPPAGRVSLLGDAEVRELQATVERLNAPQRPAQGTARGQGGLGLGVANSLRAMGRAPEQMRAWFDLWATARESQVVDRQTKLQVSLAVSQLNGCRYCVVHQVVGLRRQNVDPARLVALQKDDSQLTPRELAAVRFARQLSRVPSGITEAQYRALEAEFTPQGALEVLFQTCGFAYMNRFTDGLKLPSEEEAIRIYQEVYGEGSYAGFGKP